MIPAELFTVEENVLYDIEVDMHGEKVPMRGTFDDVDTDNYVVLFCPAGTAPVTLCFDMDSILSVAGAEGNDKND